MHNHRSLLPRIMVTVIIKINLRRRQAVGQPWNLGPACSH